MKTLIIKLNKMKEELSALNENIIEDVIGNIFGEVKENTKPKPKSNKNIILSQIWKKKFDLIGKEAVKNNIELMLQEKKILTFSHWIEEDEFGELQINSKHLTGSPMFNIPSKAIEYPCQYWYNLMEKEMFYHHYIIPCKNYNEAQTLLNKIEKQVCYKCN